MNSVASQVRRDFDEIALLSDGATWDPNAHYHEFLLRQLPATLGRVLEVGCGTGDFSRFLAAQAEHVLALDLSPNMIRIARERAPHLRNIEFEVVDVTEWPWPRAAFDCVASIATLHHLPMKETLTRMKDALRPGGTLLVLDLSDDSTLRERLISVAALPIERLIRLRRTGRLREPAHVRRAWEAHGRHDAYLPLSRVRQVCADLLPGAGVRRHLLWRYSIVWRA